MSTEKLRERALERAETFQTWVKQGMPETGMAELLRDLCAEIERLEKENGKLRDLERWVRSLGNNDWPGTTRLQLLAHLDALRGEGGKG